MQFPFYLHVFGWTVHPHPVFEGAGYVVGFSTHMAMQARLRGKGAANRAAEWEKRLWIVAGAIVGALIGAKLLEWAENWRAIVSPATDTAAAAVPTLERWLGGKTIVGGLIGGWAGVEVAKRILGVRQRTGDTWVFPLIVSMSIGRVGCFLTGLSDQTYGNATSLPWAVDFGDGIPRHPTQLYEIAFLIVLGVGLFIYERRARLGFETGRLFRMFMLGYCGWRFSVEFIKPTDKQFFGLSAIQVASLLTCIVALVSLKRSGVRVISSQENLTHA